MESGAGIEPANAGFADRALGHSGTPTVSLRVTVEKFLEEIDVYFATLEAMILALLHYLEVRLAEWLARSE